MRVNFAIRLFSMLGSVRGLHNTARPKNAQLLTRRLGCDGSRKNGPMASKNTINEANRYSCKTMLGIGVSGLLLGCPVPSALNPVMLLNFSSMRTSNGRRTNWQTMPS